MGQSERLNAADNLGYGAKVLATELSPACGHAGRIDGQIADAGSAHSETDDSWTSKAAADDDAGQSRGTVTSRLNIRRNI